MVQCKREANGVTIGEKIRKERILGGLTQKELGERMGVDASTIRKYESGKLNPKLETVQKMAQALHIDIGVLYGDDDFLGRIVQRANEKKLEEQLSRLERYLSQLNDEGRSTALDRVRELTEIPRYQDTDGRRAAQEYNRSKIESMKDVESSADVQKIIREFSRRGELPEGYTGEEWMRHAAENAQNAAGNMTEDTGPKKD